MFSCRSEKRLSKYDSKKYKESIIGKWLLTTTEFDYPTIDFQKDNSVIFSSTGDTLYSYAYHLNNDTLILQNGNAPIIKNKILKLTSDSLFFENLLIHHNPQLYLRKKP